MFRLPPSLLACFAATLMLSSGPAQAQTPVNWIGGTSSAWNDNANWSQTLPASYNAIFDSNPAFSPTSLGTNQTAASLRFTANATNTLTLGAAGDGLILAIGSGGVTLESGTGAHAVLSQLAISATQTWTNDSANAFTASGNVTLSGNLTLAGSGTGGYVVGTGGVTPTALIQTGGSRTLTVNNTGAATDLLVAGNLQLTDTSTGRRLTLNIANGAVMTVSGTVSNGGTGASGITKQGNGVLNLNGDVTYTSTTIHQAGTINWNASNSVGLAGLQIGGGGAGTSATLNLGSGVTLTLNGKLTAELQSGAGTATIANGTLALNASTVEVEVRDSANTDQELVISSNLSDGGTSANLTKTRNGTLVLQGTNTHTRGTSLSQGRLIADYRTNNTAKFGTGDLGLGGGELVLLGHAGTNTTDTVANILISELGATRVILTPGAGSTLTLQTGTVARRVSSGSPLPGGTVHFVYSDSGARVETTSANTNGILGGWAVLTRDGEDYFATVVAGALDGFATDNDDLTRQWSPTLIDRNMSDSTGFTGTTDFMDVNSVRISASNALQVLENLNIASGGLLVTSTSTSSGIFGGTLSTGTTNELIVTQNSTTDFEISSDLRRHQNSVGLGINITKSGSGTLILSGNNYTGNRAAPTTASGQIYLNEGTLVARGGNAISDNTTVTFDLHGSAIFRLESDETIGNLTGGSLDGGSLVDLGSHRLTVRLSTAQTYSGSLSGSGVFVKDTMNPATDNTTLTLDTSSSTGFTGTLQIHAGLVHLAGGGVSNLGNATAIVINKTGGLVFDNNGTTTVTSRLNDSATLTLNGANGRSGGQQAFRGLEVRTNQGANHTEQVGNLIFNTGANYFLGETGTSGDSIAILRVANILRQNSATLSVRGNNLGTGGSGTPRARLQIVPDSAAALAFARLYRVGGTFENGSTGASTNPSAVSKTHSIVPWAIGETFTSGTITAGSNVNTGNTFVAYSTDFFGFRPLNLATEYATYDESSTGNGNNVRVNLLGSDLTGASGKTINSLLVNNENNTTDLRTFSGTGTLTVTSGAFLFTGVGTPNAATGIAAQNATQGGIVIEGFDLATGVKNPEYIMFVTNTSAAGVTIHSNLVSTASFTKSGLGLLTLTGNNTSLTDITLNEGVLQISDLDNIGGDEGAIHFAGGTLGLASTWTGDSLAGRNIRVLDGTDGRLDTNGVNVTAGAFGSGSGTFYKAGTGTLTLNGSAATAHTGAFVVEHTGTTADGDVAQLILANTSGIAIGGNLEVGSRNVNDSSVTGSATVHLGAHEQIADTAVISFNSKDAQRGYFKMMGFNETVAGIEDTVGQGVFENTQNTQVNTNATLTLAGSGDYYYAGWLRDRASSSGGSGVLLISKSGSGVQTFAGSNITYTGATTLTGGLLRLRDTTSFNSAISIAAGARLEFERTNTTAWTLTRVISGAGSVTKTGTGTGATTLNATNTYTGVTDVDAGVLSLGATGSISDSQAINISHQATFNVTARTAGYSYDGIVSGGGTVSGRLILTTNQGAVNSAGSLRPGASTQPGAAATTGDQLGTLTFTDNLTLTGGTGTGSGTGAGALLQIARATLNDAAGISTAYAAGTLSQYLTDQALTWDTAPVVDTTGLPYHDSVNITGTLTIDTGSTLTYETVDGYNLAMGDVLDLWDWTSAMLGTFVTGADINGHRTGGLQGDLDLPTLSDGLFYDLSLFATHGIVVVAPEPGRAVLLSLATFLLVLRRKRRRDG